jgi:predicted Co/Zn/Cd cation transporter (cation efflux family)
MLERLPRRRWLISAAVLALTPKCVLCLAAYAGIGAALGLGGPELCGAPGVPAGPWPLLAVAGTTGGIIIFWAQRVRRRVPLNHAEVKPNPNDTVVGAALVAALGAVQRRPSK